MFGAEGGKRAFVTLERPSYMLSIPAFQHSLSSLMQSTPVCFTVLIQGAAATVTYACGKYIVTRARPRV